MAIRNRIKPLFESRKETIQQQRSFSAKRRDNPLRSRAGLYGHGVSPLQL